MPEGLTLSAGTFVCAVLEQAGYLAQAELLVEFRAFFREAGALLYIISIVGGIVSFAIFGSFRAARYLILGPVFFWFLVGPTENFAGVFWQVGTEQPRSLDPRIRGAAQAKADVNRAIESAGLHNGNIEEIKVAYFFSFFVRVINDTVTRLSHEILGNEEDYLNYISKGRALDYLISHEPNDQLLIQFLNSSLMVGCGKFFGPAIALGSLDLNDSALNAASATKEDALKRKNFYINQYTTAENDSYIRLSPENPATKDLLAYVAKKSGLAATIPTKLYCVDTWKYIATYITEEYAPAVTRKVLELARGDGTSEEEACKQIEEKITGNSSGGSGCVNRLKNIVSLYVLKNGVAKGQPFSRAAQNLADQTVDLGTTKSQGWIKVASGQVVSGLSGTLRIFSPKSAALIDNTASSVSKLFSNDDGSRQITQYVMPGENNAADKSRWSAAAKMVNIGGINDAAFTDLPRYQLRNLRQTLFSWSLNVPYWQGVILYLIAIAYPFAALLVLIPSKAQGFLTIPMAWLWVKSWDLGFAASMVFEKVLWNIFPSAQIPEALVNSSLQNHKLYEVLSETQKYDHVWNLHMYYLLLSMVTLSIPTVMGYVTLRSKRAVLASFTDKLMSDAKKSGEMMAEGHKLVMASDRVKTMKDTKGVAQNMVGVREEGGMLGNNRGLKGGWFGALGAFAAGINAVQPDKSLPANIASAAGGMRNAMNAGKAVIDAQYQYDRSQNTVNHGVWGRWGYLQMLHDAYAIQLDTTGGYEVTNTAENITDDFIRQFVQKVDTSTDGVTGVLQSILNQADKAVPGAAAVGIAALIAEYSKELREEGFAQEQATDSKGNLLFENGQPVMRLKSNSKNLNDIKDKLVDAFYKQAVENGNVLGVQVTSKAEVNELLARMFDVPIDSVPGSPQVFNDYAKEYTEKERIEILTNHGMSDEHTNDHYSNDELRLLKDLTPVELDSQKSMRNIPEFKGSPDLNALFRPIRGNK